MTPEEFWDANHEEIEHAAWLAHTQGTPNPNDDRPLISIQQMKAVSIACAEIFQTQGIFCDRTRLERLLRYLTVPDGPLVNPYEEAQYLLEQLK